MYSCTFSVLEISTDREFRRGHELCTGSIFARACVFRNTAPTTLPRLLGSSSGASGVNQAKERYESCTNRLRSAGRLNGAGTMHKHLYSSSIRIVWDVLKHAVLNFVYSVRTLHEWKAQAQGFPTRYRTLVTDCIQSRFCQLTF